MSIAARRVMRASQARAVAIMPVIAPYTDALTARTITELNAFANWGKTYGVPLAITECGYNHHEVAWGVLAATYFQQVRYHNIETFPYCADPYMGTDQNLCVYTQTPPNGYTPNFTTYTQTALKLEDALLAGMRGGVALPFQSMGVNWNGTQISNTNPGPDPNTYTTPSDASFAYLRGRGIRRIRLSIRHEYVQPLLGGSLDATNMSKYAAIASRAANAGIDIIWCLHNYGRYADQSSGTLYNRVIGDGTYTKEHLADFWKRFAGVAKGWPALAGYEITNEPHGLPNYATLGFQEWEQYSLYVGQQIRTVDAATPLYIPGSDWDGVAVWTQMHTRGPWMTGVNNVVYVGHHYPDYNHSGYFADTYSATNTKCINDGWTINGR